MKNKVLNLLFSLLLLAPVSLFAQKKNYELPKLPKEFKDLKVLTGIPAGTYEGVAIPAFYMFKEEVSNLMYREFLSYMKNKNPEVLSSLLPDSAGYTKLGIYDGELFGKQDIYPVVNVSQGQAVKYCEWLTELWNQKVPTIKVRFRLPTAKEWEYAASAGRNVSVDSYPWSGKYVRNYRGMFLAHFRCAGAPVGPSYTNDYRFGDNGWGLYHMAGNVAEWVAEPNQCKGGHWNSNDQDIKISSSATSEVSPYVGFRPIMQIVS